MERHDTKLEDETLFIEWDDEWVEIGSLEALLDLFGGETYEIEYDDAQSKDTKIVEWFATSMRIACSSNTKTGDLAKRTILR